MRQILSRFALACSLFAIPLFLQGSVANAASGLHQYKTQSGAQRHCPSDTVVWLNTDTNVYHLKGDHYYHNTKNGAYVCQKEAVKAGAKPSNNSQ